MKNRRYRVSRNRHRIIMLESKYTCSYCGGYGTTVDHIIPGLNNDHSNLTASCQSCNSTAGNRIFNSFTEKKEYILNMKKKKR